MLTLGINVGSSNLKMVMLNREAPLWTEVLPHDGSFLEVLRKTLASREYPKEARALVTGTAGRYLLNVNNVIEPLCIEAALSALKMPVDAVVSLGGENLVVYTIGQDGKIITSFQGNKCASGTGEFFKQQLGRMDMSLEQVNDIPEESNILKLSSRCSVFMKSDATHRLNKGEATKGDIVLSLSQVMAIKVIEFLKRARISQGRMLLTGGVSRNEHLVRILRERLPDLDIVVPEQAAHFEAFGAALLAREMGSDLPTLEHLTKDNRIEFERYPQLRSAEERVTFVPSRKTHVRPGREYILGVDGGSTTTKACLIDVETDEITASYYGRTHGDPVKALKHCLEEIKSQIGEDIGGAEITISMAATTGSSREILGTFLETPAVYNEIIAHATGTTFFDPEVDTIFEIGGQDAKYILLKNKVPIDYAMNEACSAGTGSFLEESCRGDLNIREAPEIGPIAMRAESPLKFGEHCSAFINSDIRKAIQQGASRENITGGIVTSIVSNYLNRVVGNRAVGNHIVMQGGVAKNQAVPIACAMLLKKDILVPPDPELMGCFGVGLMAKEKLKAGLLEKHRYELDEILATEFVSDHVFPCQACDNYCLIRLLKVNGRKYPFGGRCDKYANVRKRRVADESETHDWVERRNTLLFEECAPNTDDFSKCSDKVVGVPKAFSVHSMWPFYAWFFHNLGIETRLSQSVAPDGVARVESSYCFPAEIAHGAVQDIFDQDVDYLFLPHFRDLESMEKDVHATFCPITQGLPYYVRKAFPDIPDERILAPVVSFKYGKERGLKSFIELGIQLGFSHEESARAAETAYEKQRDYQARALELGQEALAEARKSGKPVIALLGRPYNAFTSDANMGIPRKFTSRGFSVIPYDILPFQEEEIFTNMYWYYGQQDMKTAKLLAREENIFLTYVTNFSCAPDSFMLHYIKWMMESKPFLVLELDSHSADAGVDTRVEAFLDIIDGYRSRLDRSSQKRYDNGLRFVNNGREELHILDTRTHEKIPLKGNSRVKFLLANMGQLATELCAAALRSMDVNAEAMPLPNVHTVQRARDHASGKECLPSHLVLGAVLQYMSSEKYDKDAYYLVFVPTTRGPCRTGQYSVFFDNLFRDLQLENVLVVTMDSENSYTELGPNFSKYAWWGLIIADYMKDIESALRTCAADPRDAMRRYDALYRELITVAETDVRKTIPTLRKIAREIKKIPLKRALEDCPKVLVVGEIYVRRDDFAIDELIEQFSSRGIMGKVSGIGEWIYYCDFVRRYELGKQLRMLPKRRWPFSQPFRGLVKWKIQNLYKHFVELQVQLALEESGLLTKFPHDMKRMMDNTEKLFLSHELNSEIAISSGAAATAMLDDYSGIVNISPFSCLIGRVVEGLLTPWARDRDFPLMSLEVDGSLLPPNIMSKLEIFMLNVIRFRQQPELRSLVEHAEHPRVRISRRIRSA